MRKRVLFVAAAITLGFVIVRFAGSGEDTGVNVRNSQFETSPSAVPEMIHYQGVLADDAGNPLDTTVSMTFSIYDDFTDGTALWTEIHGSVTTLGGLFNVLLSIPSSYFDGSDRWLGLTVGADPEMTPRQRMASVAYAYRSGYAEDADMLDGQHASDFASATHSHDDRYYTETELHTNDGTVNETGDPVSWYKIKDIPGGFADGVDDEGPGGGISQINAGTGITVTNPTGPTATVAADIGAGAGQVAAGDHNHDADYVNKVGPETMTGSTYGDAILKATNSGDGVGLRGESTGSSGCAVYGYNVSSDNYGYLANGDYGVLGYSSGSSGVRGIHSSGNHGCLGSGLCGVEGTSPDGYGVKGYSPNYGVYGEHSSGDYGYLGGGGYGVYGYSSLGHGVKGYCPSTGNFGLGVQGEHGSGNYGVLGTGAWGVFGQYANNSNYGYLGSISFGVMGYSSTAWGVYGEHSSGNYGYLGNSIYGVKGEATGTYGEGVKGNATGLEGVGVAGTAWGSSSWGVYGSGTQYGIYYSGGLAGSGSKSCIVKTSKGPTLLYCQESPENWFEDFGESQLSDGRCHIELDPLFLETVTINDRNPMKVFIQLNDDCNGTYVERGRTGFDVIEFRGGKNNARFTYRVVAKRRGFEGRRLDVCETAKKDPYLYSEMREKMEEKQKMEERLRTEEKLRTEEMIDRMNKE